MAVVPAAGDLVASKYRVVRRIGDGGMGVVLEAFHERLRRRVALKVLLPELAAQPAFARRFAREARAVAALESPHVVRIHDVDETPDGLPYLVMEYLEGHDLRAEYHQRPEMPAERLVDWMIQVCAAMAEAHAAGIVHRDLKPSNIFLCDHPEGPIAKVLDFGVAKVMPSQGEETTSSAGGAVGTPEYMAPEQVHSSRRVDGRADIWALGVILYRMLSGELPFKAPSWPQLAAAIAHEKPAPLGECVPEMPPALATTVMRALAKEPRERFASMSELAAALAPFGSGRQPMQPAARSSRRVAVGGTVPLTSATPTAAASPQALDTEPALTAPDHVAADAEPDALRRKGALRRRASWMAMLIGGAVSIGLLLDWVLRGR